MKQTVWNALPVAADLTAVEALTPGDYFFFGEAESKQLVQTALRHKITYHERITGDGSLAGQGSLIYRKVLDILESDDNADETKTATRPGLNRNDARDDNDRRNYRSTPWA